MSENCQDGCPSASSDLSELSDDDEVEIQRHHLETDDHISVEASPVITRRRISTIDLTEYAITPKKLKYHEDRFLSIEPTEIVDDICKTPESASEEVKIPLPKCPVKLHYDKRAKSEKACRKLPILLNHPAVLDSGFLQAKNLVVKNNNKRKSGSVGLSQEDNKEESFDNSKHVSKMDLELSSRERQSELSLQSSQSSMKENHLVLKNKKEQNKVLQQSSQRPEKGIILLNDRKEGMKNVSSSNSRLSEVEDPSFLQEKRTKLKKGISLDSQLSEMEDPISITSSLNEQSKGSSQSWSQVSDPKDSPKDQNDLTVAYQNNIPNPLVETVHRTPKSGFLELNNLVLNCSEKKCESITLSDASPLLWGSSISGISPLSQSPTEISSKCVSFHAESPKEENCTNKLTNVYTSTPLSSKISLEFEDCKEISTVTEGLSDSSSMLQVRKTTRIVNSSELQFSESQESNGSDCDKGSVYVNLSQELSESDKENVDPNSKENMPRVKRIRVETGLDCDCVDYHSNSRSCPGSANDDYLASF